MVDVAIFSIVRQADAKAALPARQNAVIMEPATPKSATIAKSAAPAWSAMTPIERVFDLRWIRFFGEHASIPEAKVGSSAKIATNAAQDAELVFAKLHDNLLAAWSARDAVKLEAVASAHLKVQATSGTPLIDPFTRKLSDFFKARGCQGTGAEIVALVGDMTNQQIIDYLASSAQLVSKLKAQAFAAMANGTLSQQGIDLILAIKSIAAFQLIASAILNSGQERPKIPVKLICATLNADICFPEWTFDVDPCRWPKGGDIAVNPRGDTGAVQIWPASATAIDAAANASAMAVSPLRKRIEREALVAQSAIRDEAKANLRTGNPPPKPNLSFDCDCHPEPDPPCLPPDPCCAKINYYVTDTLVLRDTVKRYLPADLAYIENIAAGEERVREHSFAKTIENYTEEEVTTTKSEERDHQVTERFSVQNEIEKNLKIDADLHSEYGKKDKGYFVSLDTSISKETAQKEVREQFREAVDRAVTKIQVETRRLTSSRVTTREEEKNTHSFINKGSTHTVAKYFYVSKEVEGQVFSHGLRTTVELLIPEPAALYEHLEMARIERGFKIPKPASFLVSENDDPQRKIAVEDITPENYVSLGNRFGIYDLSAPPEKPGDQQEFIVINTELPTTDQELKQWKTFTQIADRPGFYISDFSITGDIGFNEHKTSQQTIFEFHIGSDNVWRIYNKKDDLGDHRDSAGNTHIKGPVNLDLEITNVDRFSARIKINWRAEEPDFGPWKKEVWTKLYAEWKRQDDAYWEAYRQYLKQMHSEKTGRHPFTNKEIILAELKRAAIYMMCEDFERADVMAPKTPPCGYPEINRKTASEECADWYFWETAFDWRLMSFIFFDYFWNKKCEWPEKFAPGHDDFMFNAFLRSGMARIMVPVRPGMEADVIFYLETGQKWGLGGQPPINPQDPRWISVVQELKHSRDCYQNDREGMLHAKLDLVNSIPGTPKLTNVVRLEGSDRYWDPLAGTLGALNQAAIANDTGREIFIDGVRYRIVAIAPSDDPLAPAYDPIATSQTMWWDITLDRPLEAEVTVDNIGNVFPDFAYAIGAAYVGAPFRWQEPTNLVWLGDQFKDGSINTCLPAYPVKC